MCDGTTRPVSQYGEAWITRSPAMSRVLRVLEQVKQTDTAVFIMGESGTGKEKIARDLHFSGPRRKGRFVAVNCGAIPDNLLESEMFGFAKGSFSGAVREKPGLVETASRGTLFLDEIGDLPLALQAKMLRLLEENEVRRVGETRARPVDVRFVSATNKDIEQEVETGRFRKDLYYRLTIVTIRIPPLRERRDDLAPLIELFLDKYGRKLGRPARLTSQALERLLNYPWPGNVRELQNEIQRFLILSDGQGEIRADDLSPRIRPRSGLRDRVCEAEPVQFLPARAEFEKRFLRRALFRCNFNRAKTAALIGISRQGLFKLIKKHGIEIPDRRISE